MTATALFALAYLLDLIIGDPRWMPHPVRGIGRLIEKVERMLRNSIAVFEREGTPDKKAETEEIDKEFDEKYRIDLNDMVPSFLLKGKKLSRGQQEQIAGGILVAIVVVAVLVLFALISDGLAGVKFSPVAEYIAIAVYVYLISTTLATTSLLRSARAVIREVRKGDVDKSRNKLSNIVGRDTENLRETGVLRATIETLAENASDGIVAPLFYFALGGLPLAMTYKAINTLDSMVGYKNKKYKHYGWAAARLDDIANYIPARITGLLIVAASYFINSVRYAVSAVVRRLDPVRNRAGRLVLKLLNKIALRMETPDFERARNSYRVMKKDGQKHASPNSGVPEAAMAGALGIRLGGPSMYGGKKVQKPYIGKLAAGKDVKDSLADIYMEAALSAMTIIRMTSFFGFLIVLLFV